MYVARAALHFVIMTGKNEVSVPAASTLWICVAQELCQTLPAKC